VLEGASGRNLRDARIEVALGGITGVCGPSGAGKSTLVMDTLVPALELRSGRETRGLPYVSLAGAEEVRRIETVDPSDEVVQNPRSFVATLAGILDPLRTLMAATPTARAMGLGAGRFSPNLKGGRCEPCQGMGRIRIDLPYLPTSWSECPACRGTRYGPEVLEVRWRGLHLGQILSMDIEQAHGRFLSHPGLRSLLEPMAMAGLGHLPLGLPSADLSGGELARLRLCGALTRRDETTLFVLEEPSRGLHPADTRMLLELLGGLAEKGHSVLAISHDPFFLAGCDRLCELGPGAGPDGGLTLACASPEEIARGGTPTANALRSRLAGRAEESDL
jgi:excinuclease ABC subunit A